MQDQKIPTSDVSDMVRKQKPMGLKLTGAYLSPVGDKRTGYDDDYDKGLNWHERKEAERERKTVDWPKYTMDTAGVFLTRHLLQF